MHAAAERQHVGVVVLAREPRRGRIVRERAAADGDAGSRRC